MEVDIGFWDYAGGIPFIPAHEVARMEIRLGPLIGAFRPSGLNRWYGEDGEGMGKLALRMEIRHVFIIALYFQYRHQD